MKKYYNAFKQNLFTNRMLRFYNLLYIFQTFYFYFVNYLDELFEEKKAKLLFFDISDIVSVNEECEYNYFMIRHLELS